MKKIVSVLFAVLLCAVMATAVFADDVVYYENDFSDPATLADFTQYRGVWEIKDGALWLTGGTEEYPDTVATTGKTSHSFILYTAKETALTNYMIDVDMYNVQTQGGPLLRCAADKAIETDVNGFFGYIGFIAFDGAKGAIGRGNATGGWGGNLNVGSAAFSRGTDIHINFKAVGDVISVRMTDLKTGTPYYEVDLQNGEWTEGTFGFRLCLTNTDGATNIGTVHFDNLKVTVLDDEVPVITEATTTALSVMTRPTTEPKETSAPETTVSAEDTDPVTEEITVETETSAETAEDASETNSTALIIGIAAAVIVAAAVVVALVKKKK